MKWHHWLLAMIVVAGVSWVGSCVVARQGDEAEVAKLTERANLAGQRADSLVRVVAGYRLQYHAARDTLDTTRQKLKVQPRVIRIPGEPIPPETVTVERSSGPVDIEIPGEVGDVIRSCDALRVTCEQMSATAKLAILAKDSVIGYLQEANDKLSQRPTRSRFLDGLAIGGGVGIALYQIARLLIGNP